MLPRFPRRFARGLTLVELMVSITILTVVVAALTRAIVDVYRTQSAREVTTRLQGQGRDALRRMEHELRAAALGVPVGVVWSQNAAGNVVQRPAVQIFDDLSGAGANLDVKPGSDAVLVVAAVGSGAEAAVQGTAYDSTADLVVTDQAPFTVGMPLLIGPFKAATWETVKELRVTGLKLTGTQNLFPDGKAESGSLVRQARATLYFISNNDELIEQVLLVPRPPASLDEMGARFVLARGVENLQVDCDLDDGMAPQPCAAVISGADPVASEAVWAFGAWGAGGPRLNRVNVSTLRGLIVQVVIRGNRPVAGPRGDDPIAIGNHAALPVGLNGDATQPYLRRAYRLPVAVRNVSLGAL